MYSTPETRWRALQTRDPHSAAAFIYGVTTTGIFCRPTCPARLARRANVVFFDAAADASAAGFRACKRCRPTAMPTVMATGAGADYDEGSRAREGVARACEVLRKAGGERVRLEVLAREAGLSKRYFHSLFKKVVGVTPGAYAAKAKMEKTEVAASATLLGAGDAGEELLDPTLLGSQLWPTVDETTDPTLFGLELWPTVDETTDPTLFSLEPQAGPSVKYLCL